MTSKSDQMDNVRNWDVISGVSTFAFLGFLVSALVAFFYQETVDFGVLGKAPTFPYREYVYPLGFGAIVFLLITAVSIWFSFQAEHEVAALSSKGDSLRLAGESRFCSNCGSEVPRRDYVFCPFCGNRLNEYANDEKYTPAERKDKKKP